MKKQKLAWEKTKKAIDQGLPCYGWELEAPEFYVVTGYDSKGYYFSDLTSDAVRGTVAWDKLGTSDIGCLELYAVKKGAPADDKKAVKEALAKAHTLALAAGVKTGRVLEISEQAASPRPMPLARAEMAMVRSADSVPVAAGENTYKVTVHVSIAIDQ